MKNLGYYNGAYDELEKMSIPMLDRVCYFGTAFMTPLTAETTSSMRWMSTSTVFITARDCSISTFLIPRTK